MERSRSGDECRENSPWNVAGPWVSSLDDDQDAFAGHTHAYRDNQGFSDNDNDNDDCDVYGGPWSSHSERPLEQQLEKQFPKAFSVNCNDGLQSNSEERQDSDDEDFNNGAEDNLVGLDDTKQVENGEDAFYNEDGQESLPVEQDREDDDGNMIAYAGRAKTPKRKSMASLRDSVPGETFKKPKKKSTNVWNTKASRKGSKKNKASINNLAISKDFAFITAVHKVPDRMDDSPDMKICLSKIYKAEKIELTEDRLTAGSMKGYRMVRATRGVVEGAWYFEIKIINLGESGHTRLGWSTEKGDLQAPVGCDANSYSYRDIEGSKVHKGFREPYGEEYGEGDVIGFYVSLPEGAKYAPEPPQYVYYRGQLHTVSNSNSTEEQPQTVPGSEMMFFKNGVCQGVAFSNILAGRYYPAASMYTLPNQPLCKVKFNFGPNFEYFPEDFGEHPKPQAMYEAPFCGLDGKPVQQGESNAQNEVDTQPTI